jgi:SAM-dependent methyltransferase
MIHRVAAEGFARAAGAYDRGRPGYPGAAIAFLVSRLPAGATVLDLAAGTGKLTRPLLDAGLAVVAVEPVAEMRAGLPASARPMHGTAEAIPLGEGAVDAVAVGQAFHWFEGDAALAEIHRVLRPGGTLALLWNRRLEGDPVNRALDELLEPHRAGAPTHRWDSWRAAFERTNLFGPRSTGSRTSSGSTPRAWRRAWGRSASSRRSPRPSGSACWNARGRWWGRAA